MAITERYVAASAAGGGDGSTGTPWTLHEALLTASAGDRVNILNDSVYDLTAQVGPVSAGTATQPVLWRGYETTIGDGGIAIISGGAYNISVTTDYQRFESLEFRSSGDKAFEVVGGNYVFANRCNMIGESGQIACHLAGGAHLENCYLESASTNYTLYLQSTGCTVTNCYVKATGNQAHILHAFSAKTVQGVILDANGYTVTAGIGNAAYATEFRDITIYGADNGILGANQYAQNYENIVAWLTGNAGYLFDLSAHTAQARIKITKCAGGNYGTARLTGMTDIPEVDAIVLTADPFTDAANQDFSLNSDAGGGALCTDAGRTAPVTMFT